MSDGPYVDIKNYFEKVNEVVVNTGKGSQGIKYGKTMFIMFYKGDLLVQLPPERVDELIASGEVQAFDPGTGKPMKDRVLISASKKGSWIDFCEESLKYVKSKS